jgi:Leucine-rich repeat (LRR) protein
LTEKPFLFLLNRLYSIANINLGDFHMLPLNQKPFVVQDNIPLQKQIDERGKSYCNNIKNLSLSKYSFKVTKEDINKISTDFPNLRYLSLRNCNISDKATLNLNQLTDLENLNLTNCKKIKNTNFLSGLSKLTKLNISGTKIESLIIDNPKLVELCASNCDYLKFIQLNTESLKKFQFSNPLAKTPDEIKESEQKFKI